MRAPLLCISAQTVSLLRVTMVFGRRLRGVQSHMLFIVGLLSALIAVVSIPWMRVPGGVNPNLGCMSRQWLAEHQASHDAP